MKREFYVSPDRFREIKESVKRGESRDSNTYDYQIQNDVGQHVRKVILHKKETVFNAKDEND